MGHSSSAHGDPVDGTAPQRVATLVENAAGWMLCWGGQERVRFSRAPGDNALLWEYVAWLRGRGVSVDVRHARGEVAR